MAGFHLRPFVVLTFVISILCSLAVADLSPPKLEYVPAKASSRQVNSRFTALPKDFDGPFLSSVNSSTFEWWWFEAVADDLKSSLTIIFFTTSGEAFPLSGNTDKQTTSVFISGLLPNGTVFYGSLPASGAIFASGGPLGKAASAEFVGTGATFVGSPDLTEYKVDIDSLGIAGIKGSLTFTSGGAPAHYGCSKNLNAGQTLEVFPNVGWTNALPGAKASGSMRIGDQTLIFKNALGYHDHNWGDRPFTTLIKSWYWGHATLGPYTVVWFDGIGTDGKEHVTAYLAQGSEILQGSCTPGSVRVRPKGRGATYPPTPGPGSKFKYWELSMKLCDGKEFVAKVVPKSVNINAKPLYTRWIGTMTGGMQGEKVYSGPSAFEQFTIS